MLVLEHAEDPKEYEDFIHGKFTIGRSEKTGSGTWADMIIEQSIWSHAIVLEVVLTAEDRAIE